MYSTREISLDVMQKPARNKGKHTEGQRMETSGSAQEHDWVVGSQILTQTQIWTRPYLLIQRVMLAITGVKMESGIFTRNLVSHGAFKGAGVDQRHCK